MDLPFIIILVIALGVILIFVEAFLLPGTGVVGVLGGLALAGGVYLVYDHYGRTEGTISLLVSLALVVFMIVMGFKRISDLKWADASAIDGRMNVLEENIVHVGEKGKAFGALRPNGKALIAGKKVEVYSIGEFIDKDTDIVVTKVTPDKIYVKAITN
jgi:membrane-bound ClpP family serine protease